MNHYVELALKKEKKPASWDKIVSRIEKIKSDELGKDVYLTDEEVDEVFDILEDGVSKYEIYKTRFFLTEEGLKP